MIAVIDKNNTKNQIIKQRHLLQRIRRQQPVSRLQLARQVRFSNSRVCELVEDMLGQGLLVEEHNGHERRGRRGVPLRLNPAHGHFIGFDMEAKRLRLVVVDFAGNTVWQVRKHLRPPRDRQALIDMILDFFQVHLKQIKDRFNNLLGIGLAANGVIDTQHGVILHYDLMPAANNIPLRDLVASRFGLPCVMEDNIRALTLAEWINGAGRHLDSFICLAVRSGVGAGIIINGRLHCGSHGFAGEAGYMTLPTGPNASHWKVLQHVVSEQAMGVDVESKGFELSPNKARRAGELLGSQIATMASLLDPQAIVLAGGLLDPAGPVWDHIVRVFRQLALRELVERVQILPARLGPFAAAVGATHHLFEELYPVNQTVA